jgi:hypothetical protein
MRKEPSPRSRPARTVGILLLLAMAGGAQADPASDYAQRAAKLKPWKDAKAWLRLADFAEDGLLWERRDEALRRALEADPGNAEAHARLDEVKVGEAWLPAEEAWAREAEENLAKGRVLYGAAWVPPGRADSLREADRKQAGWPLEFRFDTPHLRIYSGRPLPFTRRLAAILENEVEAYLRMFGKTYKVDPRPCPFRVYLFADRDTYARVQERETGVAPYAGQGGYYSDTTKVLYVGVNEKGGSDARVLHLAAHEMSHALDHLAARLPDSMSPMWRAEGQAEYFGYSIRGRRILPGTVTLPPGDTAPKRLAEMIDTASLRDLMALDTEAFMKDSLLTYPLSWAWIHFLFHGQGGKHAPGFRTYLQGIPRKRSVADFERAVGRLSDLEPAFKRYVKESLVPAAESGKSP